MRSPQTFSYSPIIQVIREDLVKAETRRLNRILVEVNREHRAITMAKHDGFVYNGTFYLPNQPSITHAGPKGRADQVHPTLEKRMQDFEADKKIVVSEAGLISQILFVILDPCTSQQDMRDALPECLVECVEGLSALPRTNQEVWTILSNPRAMRQYEKLHPRMIFYTMARLLY